MMKIFKQATIGCAVATAALLTCLAGVMPLAQAAGPATLNYQGFLSDQKSGLPVNASVSVTFTFFDALSGGNSLYSETQSLTAVNGVINAQIGSVTAFPATLAFDKPYWLELKVGSDTLAPRQPLASSGYARTASGITSFGSWHTKAGDFALQSNTTGTQNTAFGHSALFSNTTGIQNTASGQNALYANTTGNLNTACGQAALYFNTTGGWNTASGQAALFNNTSGSQNTASGEGALASNTTGSQNTASGQNTLHDNTTGSSNTAIGNNSGLGLLTGSSNIYLGAGVAAATPDESGTTRIGRPVQARAFMGGIRDVMPANDNGYLVFIDSNGQLGSLGYLAFTAAGLNFGMGTHQMLNLFGTSYGIGVQNNMMYARTASGFGWFQGGAHSDAWNDPGAGGRRLMGLSEQGLRVVGSDLTGANDITLLADGSIHAKVVNTTSDRNAKENFADVDPRAVLAKLAQLPLHTWNYRGEDARVKHLGPVAQDFSAAFHVGADDKHIATVDADGVALAAIQGLYRMVQEKDAELAQLKAQLDQLRQAVDSMVALTAGPTQVVLQE